MPAGQPPFPTNGQGTRDHAPMPKGGDHASSSKPSGGKYTKGPKGTPGPKGSNYPSTTGGGK